VNPLYDGLLEYGIELVGARSEQEAGFLACMEARVTRRPAVCIAENPISYNTTSSVSSKELVEQE
jgi:thiamine pyrophosphate-dependent acetolactate synthase large subunit-like protein